MSSKKQTDAPPSEGDFEGGSAPGVPDDRMRAILGAAKAFEAFRPARQVLRRVRAVPTRFVQFDHATRVGGLPVERFMLVHGASNEGKSIFSLGLVDSFLARGHYALYIDAERTTPITWVEQLMGAHADHPAFFAMRPESYEQTIADVRNFLNTLADQREQGKLPQETSALVVCDSLRKLVPADLMKEILAAEAEASDVKGGRDRRAQIQAKMNAAWMDELVPLLERSQAAFVAIAREMQDPDADMWAKRYGNDYKVGGGIALYYDSSLVMRVERASWVTDGEGASREVYGERHRVTIKKTKVAGKDDKVAQCFFSTSNGVFLPEGFDRARDVLELAVKFGVAEQRGAQVYWRDGRVGRGGTHNAVKHLTENPADLRALEAEVRAAFPHKAPEDFDPETGEVA